MSVNLIWSLTNGGDPLEAIVNHGNSSNGDITASIELFVRHDGDNEITGAGLYVSIYTGSYSGGVTAAADLAELLGWGDGATAAAFGGFQCNLLATTNYPDSGWPIYTTPSPTGGFVHRTGTGDSEGNAVVMPVTTGATASGEIQSGASPNVRFKIRCEVPTDEDTIGLRQWDHKMTYSYTS